MRNKLIASFVYAFKGILNVIINERNMKIHLSVLSLVVIAGFLLHISVVEWIACLLCFGAVLSAESFNTAIEKMLDEVSPEFNKKFGDIKDIAAGAVLITTIFSVIIGIIIFLPKGFHFISQL